MWLDSDISTTKTPNTPNRLIDYGLKSARLWQIVLIRIRGRKQRSKFDLTSSAEAEYNLQNPIPLTKLETGRFGLQTVNF